MAINFIIAFVVSLSIVLFYFRIAVRYQIIDKPNLRSSHSDITVRGGGIIFPLACLAVLPFISFEHLLPFCTGLILISLLSFADDINNLNSILRLAVQSIAVLIVVFPFLSHNSWPGICILFILFIGIINAYNFMDGINGITSLYSIVTVGSLFWVSQFISPLLPDLFFLSVLAALVAFSFFNVRTKARCFAGDVGSVSIAFIICFLLLVLFFNTGFYYWILFLGIYGMDTVFTIFCRLIRKEAILKAHRSHFYQFLVNEMGMGHISVSLIYAFVQFLLNAIVIVAFQLRTPWMGMSGLLVILVIYTTFRLRLEGRYRLFTLYSKLIKPM